MKTEKNLNDKKIVISRLDLCRKNTELSENIENHELDSCLRQELIYGLKQDLK